MKQMQQRRHERIEDPGFVEVKLYSVQGQEDLNGQTLSCRAHDVSEGGIRLTMDRRLPIETPVKLRITIPNPPSIFTHQAEVRWSSNGGTQMERYTAGLEFTGGSEAHMMEWRRLLRHVAQTDEVKRPAAQES